LHPVNKLPIIDDDGFVMAESVAILRYLARERKVADHWYPSDSMKQFRVDEYLEWQHLTARRLCMAFFQAKFLLPMVNNTPANETEVEKAFQAMLPCLKQMEEIWLDGGKKKFLIGDEITVADLLGLCELEQPGMADYDVFARHPILGAWRDRVRQVVGPHYETAHRVVREFTAKYGGVPPLKG